MLQLVPKFANFFLDWLAYIVFQCWQKMNRAIFAVLFFSVDRRWIELYLPYCFSVLIENESSYICRIVFRCWQKVNRAIFAVLFFIVDRNWIELYLPYCFSLLIEIGSSYICRIVFRCWQKVNRAIFAVLFFIVDRNWIELYLPYCFSLLIEIGSSYICRKVFQCWQKLNLTYTDFAGSVISRFTLTYVAPPLGNTERILVAGMRPLFTSVTCKINAVLLEKCKEKKE